MPKWMFVFVFILLFLASLAAFPRLAPRLYLSSFDTHSRLIANQDVAISALFNDLKRGRVVNCADFLFYGFPSPRGKTVPVYTPEPDNLLLAHPNIIAKFPYISTDSLNVGRVESMELVAKYNSLLWLKCPQIAGNP